MTYASAARMAALTALIAAPAFAAPTAAELATEANHGLDIMSHYNLITLGNMSAGHDVEGSTFVGGDLTGNSATYFKNGVDGPGVVGLTVVGSLTSGNANLQGGDIQVGGNVSQKVNLNGSNEIFSVGGSYTQSTSSGSNTISTNVAGLASALQTTKTDYVTTLTDLSTYLANLTPTAPAPTVVQNQTVMFNAGAGTGLAVIDISGDSLLSGNEQIGVNYGAYDTLVINVSGTSDSFARNWTGDPDLIGMHVIWNFYQATSLTFNREFYGSVLAPLATVHNSSPIDGTVVAAAFDQGGEVHLAGYGGGYHFDVPGPPPTPVTTVPEPASWALMLTGFLGLGAALRRRRTPAAA